MSFDNILGRPAEPEKTVWRQVIDFYQQPGVDWITTEPEWVDSNGVKCYCAGGALAEVIAGRATRMYATPGDWDYSPELDVALGRLADHIGAGNRGRYGTIDNCRRVYGWNDHLPEVGGKEIVLKALEELDELERASK